MEGKESWELLEEEEDREKSQQYELAYKNKRIVISQENVWKVNAMLKSNSFYQKSGDPKSEPVLTGKREFKDYYKDASGSFYKTNDFCGLSEQKITMICADDNNQYKYLGSSSFWFSKLKGFIYNKCDECSYPEVKYIIYKTVCAVDNENSTHLNADGIGRAVLSQRIFEMLKKGELIKNLTNPEKYTFKIIRELSAKPEIAENFTPKPKKAPRYCLSFATKWCCYACLNMLDTKFSDNFAKVDTVVKKALLENYEEKLNDKKFDYEGRKESLLFLLKDSNKKDPDNPKKNKKDDKRRNIKETANEKIGKYYKQYLEIIDTVRDGKVSRNGLDHLLWYSNKGLYSGDDDE